MLSRLARWWLRRAEAKREARRPPFKMTLPGECICGKEVAGPNLHMVIALSDDDASLGIKDGQTAMSADFCAEHCPGGCTQGCVASVV